MSIESKVIERIKFYMRKKKKSQEEVAKAMGIDRSTLTHILTNRTKITLERLLEIADVLQINATLLTEGVLDIPTGSVKLSNDEANTVPYIPLINAHKWRIKMQDAKENPNHLKIPFDKSKYSDNCFYTKIDTSLLSPIFLQDDDIVVDPLRTPENGNYVVVTLLKDGINVVRQYYIQGSKIYLKAVENLPLESYTPRDIKIVGVIVKRQINMV